MSESIDAPTPIFKERAKWLVVRWVSVAGTLTVSQDKIQFFPGFIDRIFWLFTLRSRTISRTALVGLTLSGGGRRSVLHYGPVGANRLVILQFRDGREIAVFVKQPELLLAAINSDC